MFFKIIKVLFRLFGMIYMAETMKIKLGEYTCALQHVIVKKTKKISGILLLSCMIFILFSSALRFLLLGLAHWLNIIFSSIFLGFFIVAIFCFLMIILFLFLLIAKINKFT